MANINLTEDEVETFLLGVAKSNGETAPRCVVVVRTQLPRGLTRLVKFGLIVTSNNSALVDALIQECLSTLDDKLVFVGSEVNLQSDLEIDYLYFEAKIFASKNKVA